MLTNRRMLLRGLSTAEFNASNLSRNLIIHAAYAVRIIKQIKGRGYKVTKLGLVTRLLVVPVLTSAQTKAIAPQDFYPSHDREHFIV